MNMNVPIYHGCGARLQGGRTCHALVRAPRTYCGTHQNQYNRITNNGQDPQAWEQHTLTLIRRAEQRALAWVNTHPVMSRFPQVDPAERMNRYVKQQAFFVEINAVLEDVTGYFFPRDVIRVTVTNAIPEPFRTYLTGLAVTINRAINALWTLGSDISGDLENILADIVANAPRKRQLGELGRFANDNQNVHLTATVQMVKDVVDRVLKIPVPLEFRGNRTVGEVILYTPMPPESVQWFVKKYFADEDIYDYGNGIYAKVVDSVWQYIRSSPDKMDLCKILATELTDSVGMCAQGNLTRVCNVLSGYLEGINTETHGEQLQRRMAQLMELEKPEDRIREGKKILEELAVPLEQRDAWIEALS
jgi:hypothetical protein